MKKIRPIASSLGNVIEIEDDFLEIEQYCKVRVLLDDNKPLRKMQKIRVKGENIVKVLIKYERFPHFCFYCDLMSRTDRDCNIVNEEDIEKGCSWGLDIKTSLRRGFIKNKEEVDNLKLKRNIFVTKPKHSPKGPCNDVLAQFAFLGIDTVNNKTLEVSVSYAPNVTIIKNEIVGNAPIIM